MSEFVTFEISKKLKEKGFSKLCFATYDKDGMLGYNYCQPTTIRAISFEECMSIHGSDDNCIDAPTISQVLKWLRERDIMVEIIPSLVDDGTWTFSFRIQTKKFYDRSTKDYNSYELAALTCIEYILDNLI